MGKTRLIYIIAATGCLGIGTFAYVLFRPDSLLMFQWFEFIGLRDSVYFLREIFSNLSDNLPETFIFSVPFALWVLSYLFFVKAIWHGSSSRISHLWFWAVPILAIGTELLQKSPMVSGRFDVMDINAIVIAVVMIQSIILIEKYTLIFPRKSGHFEELVIG